MQAAPQGGELGVQGDAGMARVLPRVSRNSQESFFSLILKLVNTEIMIR